MSLKNPVTPPGIDSGTVRLVAQRLNHHATPGLQLRLYREMIAVCSQIHTKHINPLCGQNVGFFNVIPGGTYSNHSALQG